MTGELGDHGKRGDHGIHGNHGERARTGEHDGLQAPEARRYGFPAVNGHEVVAISCIAHEDGDDSEPGHICVIRWRGGGIVSERVPQNRLHVWARAGRISFVSKEGQSVDLTLLGEHEYEGLRLGTPWPTMYKDSKLANIAAGVAHDVKNTITFPTSFPRMMRISGERNVVLDALVGWCEREIPDIHVLRGWPRGQEGPTGQQIPALPHKGLLGEPGWLDAPSSPPGEGPAETNQH